MLRKQPPGKLLRGAHAVDREFQCMTALGEFTSVPVPKMRLFVEDAEVLGTPFFVCDYVTGRFFDDPSMRAAASPADRKAMYAEFLKAVGALHTADYKAAGLGSFGKEGGYVARQTKVWTSQYRAAETEELKAMERLISWLPEALPAEDDLDLGSRRPESRQLHFWADLSGGARGTRLGAIRLLGHPGTDLALVTMPYDTPEAWPKALSGFGDNLTEKGIPTEHELVGTYVDMTGLTSIPHHLDYYRAFSCFRMASTLQGVYKRSTKGQASSADGAKIGKLAGVIAQLGGKIADRYEKQPDRLVSAAGAGSAFSGGASGGRRGYSTSTSAARRGLLSTGRRGLSTAAATAPPPPSTPAAAMDAEEYLALKQRLLEFMHNAKSIQTR